MAREKRKFIDEPKLAFCEVLDIDATFRSVQDLLRIRHVEEPTTLTTRTESCQGTQYIYRSAAWKMSELSKVGERLVICATDVFLGEDLQDCCRSILLAFEPGSEAIRWLVSKNYLLDIHYYLVNTGIATSQLRMLPVTEQDRAHPLEVLGGYKSLWEDVVDWTHDWLPDHVLALVGRGRLSRSRRRDPPFNFYHPPEHAKNVGKMPEATKVTTADSYEMEPARKRRRLLQDEAPPSSRILDTNPPDAGRESSAELMQPIEAQFSTSDSSTKRSAVADRPPCEDAGPSQHFSVPNTTSTYPTTHPVDYTKRLEALQPDPDDTRESTMVKKNLEILEKLADYRELADPDQTICKWARLDSGKRYERLKHDFFSNYARSVKSDTIRTAEEWENHVRGASQKKLGKEGARKLIQGFELMGWLESSIYQ